MSQGISGAGFDNETDNINDLRNAAIAVTAAITFLVAILYAIKFFCCRSAAYASRETEDGDLAHLAAVLAQSASAANNGATNNSRIPFSSRIRRMYLEAALKHEIFHEHDDMEKGMAQEPNFIVKQSSSVRTMHSCDDIILHPSSDYENKVDAADLPNTAVVPASEDMEEGEIAMTHCAICYDALHEGDEITTSNCNKTFHRQCIVEWLMQHDLCPYCRNPFKNICEESKTVDYFTNMDCESSSSEFQRRDPFHLAELNVVGMEEPRG